MLDKEGKILNVNFRTQDSTTTDTDLVDEAMKNARQMQFGKGKIDEQCGVITYKFK